MAYSELPVELIERHGLATRVHERGGEPEVRFLLAERERVLPVWLHGALRIVRWGNRRGQSRGLPCTAWTWLATIENGGWGERGALPVVIPATMGLDRGVWFRIREGVRGVVVPDESGGPVVYVLCEPASQCRYQQLADVVPRRRALRQFAQRFDAGFDVRQLDHAPLHGWER